MRYQARLHPTLDILCDSMGRVFLPATRGYKAHWTFGSLHKTGHRRVCIAGKTYKVARLICEAFHGLAPADRPTCDHIDRNRDRNVPENLRWLDTHGQNNNRQICYDSLKKYGVRKCEDRNAYQRARYANNPEEILAKNAAYAAKQKALGKVRRICPDGKKRYVAKEN